MLVVSIKGELEEPVGRVATATADINPHIRLLHPAFSSDLQIDRGLVHKDHPALKHPLLHCVVDRSQGRAEGEDPVGEGLAADFDLGSVQDPVSYTHLTL